MEVVILAGGRGRRMFERTADKPKPLVEIGGRPILWHILRHFQHFGFEDFVIASGYRGSMIRDYVADAGLGGRIRVVDTGLDTATGGRLRRLAPLLSGGSFMMTWADAVADIDLHELKSFHASHGRLATVTAVHPPARFGRLNLVDGRVTRFSEKRPDPDEWINGAYFVLEPAVLELIDADDTVWEEEPIQRLVSAGELMAYRHAGFWRCADTVYEVESLERLWSAGRAPWRIWSG